MVSNQLTYLGINIIIKFIVFTFHHDTSHYILKLIILVFTDIAEFLTIYYYIVAQSFMPRLFSATISFFKYSHISK
uniref:Uncharacterized protein n=1 Tax=CrAss-like virus sp. ctYsL76 TaxID=2826826 RepID=A0A8S5QLE4_9CAUD|nr:MAG TPA: hypothetical protein [CrAss-like virus sp. ctYsL76]